MRNPRILNFYILFLIFNLNLIIQTIPSSSYESELKPTSNNSDSWGRIINPNQKIYYPTMRFINDNIYIAGHMNYNSYYAIYTTKYNSSGVKLWEKIWDSSVFDNLKGFEIDSAENVYILGTTSSLGSGQQPESIFLLKYSNSGEFLWYKILNSSYSCDAYSIKLDLNDSIYISGGGWSPDIEYNFLVKLNSSGNIMWYRNLTFSLQKIQIDTKNNIYGCEANFINKYNSSGSKLWSKELGEFYYASSLELDSNENIILTGYYGVTHWILKYNNSGIFMNKLEFTILDYDWWVGWCQTWLIGDNFYIFIDYPYSPNSCLLKYNSTLHIKWNVSLNDHFVTPYWNSIILAIVIDSHENIIILYNNPRGNYTSEISKEKYHAEDISVLKLNSSGEILSHYYWGGSYHDEPIQMLIDPLNNMYLLCTSTYVDIWNIHRDRIVLVKNPEINGTPPQLKLFGKYDYYIFSLMGVMSVISIILLISIIKPKLNRIFEKKKSFLR